MLGDLTQTGRTDTNVGDLQVILVGYTHAQGRRTGPLFTFGRALMFPIGYRRRIKGVGPLVLETFWALQNTD